MNVLTIEQRTEKIEEMFPELMPLRGNACLTCGLCASGCPMAGVDGLDPRKVLRMCIFGLIEEAVNCRFPWICTQCGRCTYYCPMGVDIPFIMEKLKGKRPRDKVPGVLHKNVENALTKGNSIGLPKEEYIFILKDVAEELAEESCPGFEIPIDQEGAEYLFFPHPKEIAIDSDDMKWWWELFYKAKVSWTVPSENWESIDWGFFTGNEEVAKELARRKVETAIKLKVKTIIIPDCGGSSFGFRYNVEKYFRKDLEEHGINCEYVYDVLIKFLKEGLIKVDKSKNPEPVTYHDACKHGREALRVFGKGYFDEPRWIIDQCCQKFIEMYPNRENSFCCGAGGGLFAGPYGEDRIYHGRKKVDSIRNTGAKIVIASCSNCRDQIQRDLTRKYNLDVEVKYIWQLVAESLIE